MKKKYTEDDLRAAMQDAALAARGKQIVRSAEMMQQCKDETAGLQARLDRIKSANQILRDFAVEQAKDDDPVVAMVLSHTQLVITYIVGSDVDGGIGSDG